MRTLVPSRLVAAIGIWCAVVAYGTSTAHELAHSSTCPHNDAGLTLPSGFCATIFADNVGHARHLTVAPNGVVYVNTWSGSYFGNDVPHEGGFLVALQDTVGAGRADVQLRFGDTVQNGGAGGTGIAWYNGALYAEANDKIVRYSFSNGTIVPTGPPNIVLQNLPLDGNHPMHPFAIDAQGHLYVDLASATNSCQPQDRTLESRGAEPCIELKTRGGIWRYDANKENQQFTATERFATGIRNAEGFAIDKAGRIFVTQHGRDQLHSNWPAFYSLEQEATLPAEELLLLKQDGDYGWPACYFDPARRALILAPEYGGDAKKIGRCARKVPPVAYFPAHWGPDGMVFYDKSMFPSRYRDGVFIAFHGSWNRAPFSQSGYNVVYQPLRGARASGRCEIFADGFAGAERSPDKAEHRPTGMAIGPDGALYVSDDVRGRIYRITYHGGGTGRASRPVECPSATAPAGERVAYPSTAATTEPAGDDGKTANDRPIPDGATRDMLDLGDRIYHGEGGTTCTGCHGASASGSSLAPNLTNNRWYWSDGTFAGIAATIRVGVAHPKNFRAPMPAMGGAELTADQVSAVAAYLWSINQPRTP